MRRRDIVLCMISKEPCAAVHMTSMQQGENAGVHWIQGYGSFKGEKRKHRFSLFKSFVVVMDTFSSLRDAAICATQRHSPVRMDRSMNEMECVWWCTMETNVHVFISSCSKNNMYIHIYTIMHSHAVCIIIIITMVQKQWITVDVGEIKIELKSESHLLPRGQSKRESERLISSKRLNVVVRAIRRIGTTHHVCVVNKGNVMCADRRNAPNIDFQFMYSQLHAAAKMCPMHCRALSNGIQMHMLVTQ